jgi:hypothetical protein
VLAIVFLQATLGPARAADPQDANGFDAGALPVLAFDLLVLRTLGGAATGLGFLAFVAAFPFTAPTIGYEEPWEVFVLGPAEYTFVRPLGSF